MRLVRPVQVSGAMLTATNVALDEPMWSAATTYASGARVRGTAGDPALKVYESLVDGNLNQALTDPEKWIEVGAVNRWRMFDASPQSLTSRPDAIAVQIKPGERVDTFRFEGLSAATLTVTATDAVDGVVYDQEIDLTSTVGIVDGWTYCFEPIVRLTSATISDLPPYSNLTFDITLAATGETVSCGLCLPGLSRRLGGTQWGGRVGILDYSRKEVDDFGFASIVERTFAKRGEFSVVVDLSLVDAAQDLLAEHRATPVLFIASERFGATAVYGFFRDFQIELGPAFAVLNIQLEGLA